MYKRQKVSKKRSKKSFSRTGAMTHKKNVRSGSMRGGNRL